MAARRSHRPVAFAAFAALLSTAPALTQSGASSAEARAAQYLLVIDDSGSMKKTEPDRLAVFAVRSLLSMLDDRDEVSIVRLNASVDGEAAPPIRPLGESRDELERLLALDGRLARYAGQNTLCRSALDEAARLLEAAYRPNVAQTVIFLTDGKCEPANERPQPDALLGRLASHRDDLFRFFLLRFRGLPVSPELVELARATGGEAFDVDASDPTAILHPFALALSRSQGYDAQLLAPAKPTIDAHRGARRVRLLAVAPGEGEPLAVSLYDREGRPVAPLAAARTGTHRYDRGRTFRYAALDYRPTDSPVTVKVAGAGGQGWRVVVLPEYRLFARSQILRGGCAAPGAPLEHSADTGTTVCVVVELVDEQGRVVSGDATGRDLEPEVHIRRADRPQDEPIEMPGKQLGAAARYGVERPNMEQGDYSFHPLVRLRLGGSEKEVALRAPAMPFTVSSIVVTAEPRNVSFGEVHPGEDKSGAQLTLRGNFQETPGRIELVDRRDIPACVVVELAGKREGEAQVLSANQPYSLVMRVAPFCGAGTLRRHIGTRLRIAFDAASGARPLPAVEVPLDFTLVSSVQVSESVAVAVRGGEPARAEVLLKGNHRRDLALTAIVEGGGAGWPSERLEVGFADGSPAVTVPPGEAAVPLGLAARAHRCCPGGSYAARLRLEPADAAGYASGGRPVEPIVVPVRVEVEPAGFWACRGSLVLWILLGLLLLLLALYVVSMIRHSSFLDVDRLAEKLVPLAWGSFGSTVPRRDAGEVRRLVTRTLTPGRRLGAWLKANPLRFGLPGGSYRETVELLLQPHRDLARTQLVLKADRDLPARLRREPEAFAGRLFAIAEGGVTFVAVPAAEGRIGPLVEPGAAAAGGWQEEVKPKAVTLRRGTRLLRPTDDWEVADEGGAAGWQLG